MKILICDPCESEVTDFLKKNKIEIIYNPQISSQELITEVSKYEGLLVRSRTKVTSEIIKKGKSLRFIGRIGAGVDNIDIEECRRQKILVVNAPFSNSQSVAELTVGLIISLLRKINIADNSMKTGAWIKNEIKGCELSGKTVGIIGYGNIGKKVAEILKVFDCKLLIYSKSNKNTSLANLFSKSDIVTVHTKLTVETRGLIDKKLLGLMKKESYFLNISRGEIVKEDDLYDVLFHEKIAGVALDVYLQEPLPEDSRWRKLNNVILTPHIAGSTIEAMKRAGLTVAADIVRISKGETPKFKVI